MRNVNVKIIKRTVFELCRDANFNLRSDIYRALKKSFKAETNRKAKKIIGILLENAQIARREKRALCQDTGLVSAYLSIGQDVRLVGGDLKKAVTDGVEEAYKKHFLRKSVVGSPILRKNTNTNTPSLITTDIVKGNKVKVVIMPKGFGSENKSRLIMLNPTDGEKEIVSFVVDAVKKAGPDACPPYILGVGIGGAFDKVSSLAKQALLVPIDKPNKKKYLKALESKILKAVNKLNIGPMGLGGKTTCLGVKVLEHSTHIAGLPLAVNIGCHVTRSASKVL